MSSRAAQQDAIEELRALSPGDGRAAGQGNRAPRLLDRKHVSQMARGRRLAGSQLGLDAEQVQLCAGRADARRRQDRHPEEILRKPGPLTPEERQEMNRHTIVGHEILAGSQSELLQLAATIALTHHERYDGADIRRAWTGRRFRSRDGSPRSPTSSTRCSATAPTGRR